MKRCLACALVFTVFLLPGLPCALGADATELQMEKLDDIQDMLVKYGLMPGDETLEESSSETIGSDAYLTNYDVNRYIMLDVTDDLEENSTTYQFYTMLSEAPDGFYEMLDDILADFLICCNYTEALTHEEALALVNEARQNMVEVEDDYVATGSVERGSYTYIYDMGLTEASISFRVKLRYQ